MNKHFARRLALAVAACFSWSLVLASSARAITARPPAPPSRTWALSAKEMQRIIGATAIRPDPTGGNDGTGTGASSNAGATPGPIVPWVGSVGDVSTGTGNKLTVVPVVGWTARGGLKVQFSLFHASQSSRTTGYLNPKWSISYQDSSVAEWNNGSGNVTPNWDDQSAYTFSRNVDGSYSRPAGIHDTLDQKHQRLRRGHQRSDSLPLRRFLSLQRLCVLAAQLY